VERSPLNAVFERALGRETTLVTVSSITLELEAWLARRGRVGQGSCRGGIWSEHALGTVGTVLAVLWCPSCRCREAWFLTA
jgi:hypothetical protein